jgi:uncharacterized protein (TIGR02186 family)
MKNSGLQSVKRKAFLSLLSIIIGLSSSLLAFRDASAELTVKANHDHITIDFFYHGSSVSVRGVSDPGTDLVIKITSPEEDQSLRKKGKVAGLLWMNVGNVSFQHVPSLYLLHSTKKPEDILDEGERDRNGIGYDALERRSGMHPEAAESEKAKWFGEFVKLKEDSRVFSSVQGMISTTEKDGKQNYYVMMDWPYQASPGNYTVTVYAVKDRKVVETAEANVLVEQVGIVKSFAGMAKRNAAVYGMISIMAALAAGFGVGIIFRKGGGAH